MSLLEPGFLRKLEALALWAEQPGRGQPGERAARSAGSGLAFAGHRAYVPGDDFRFIDFALYARSDRLYVKQFEEERELPVEILLDCSGSMAGKLALAKQLAAALGYLALVHADRVALQPFASAPLARLEPLRGPRRALLLLRHLEALQAEGGTDLVRAARAVRARARRGGLAFVISDGFDGPGLFGGVDLLRHAHLAPVALLLHDAEDAEPTLEGELTLVDRETGQERALTVDASLRARYREAYRAQREALRRGLRERRIPTLEIDASAPIERVVLSLRRAGIVR
jgi:uncharacterized protein (DUF58 family)